MDHLDVPSRTCLDHMICQVVSSHLLHEHGSPMHRVQGQRGRELAPTVRAALTRWNPDQIVYIIKM